MSEYLREKRMDREYAVDLVKGRERVNRRKRERKEREKK